MDEEIYWEFGNKVYTLNKEIKYERRISRDGLVPLSELYKKHSIIRVLFAKLIRLFK